MIDVPSKMSVPQAPQHVAPSATLARIINIKCSMCDEYLYAE